MNQEEQGSWLETLKVGDEVCYKNRWTGYHIVEIQRITPTRQIKTTNGYTFKDGYHRLDDWERYELEPVTDVVRDNILFTRLKVKVKNFDFGKCNLEQLKIVSRIIDEVEVNGLP